MQNAEGRRPLDVSVMRQTFVLLIVATLLVAEHPLGAQAPTAPTGNAEKGKTLFVERACWQCHGLAAQGGGIAGPRLAGRVPAWPAFSRYVRRPTEEMIPYTPKSLPDSELADIYAWLRAIPAPPAVSSIPQLNRK
jgi:mono/diheme cytochrome c family protein